MSEQKHFYKFANDTNWKSPDGKNVDYLPSDLLLAIKEILEGTKLKWNNSKAFLDIDNTGTATLTLTKDAQHMV